MISVIIPTANRTELLIRALRSLGNQQLPAEEFEVIVVENSSNPSAELKNAVEEISPSFKIVHEPLLGLHYARHRGWREAMGDILVYADDDIQALPTWLSSIQEMFMNPAVGLVGGKCIPDYEQKPPSWVKRLWVHLPELGRYLPQFSLCDFGDQKRQIHPHYIFGCNFAIRSTLLKKIEGFHPDGMPPDMIKYRGDGETYVAEQVIALGFEAWYHPLASIKHKVTSSRMTMEYLAKRSFMEGITGSYHDIRYKNKRSLWRMQLGVVRSWFRGKQATVICKSYYKGYRFHNQECHTDRSLMEWVNKENYLLK